MPTQTRPPVWVIWGLVIYVGAVAVVVLSPVSYRSIIHALGDAVDSILGDASFGSGWIEFSANILLFVPLGFLLTLLLRHHWYGVLLALVLSAGVEVAQIVIPSRQPSLRDIVANVLGAALGAGLAWLFVLRRERSRTGDGED